jgi:phosphocarrier protein
VNGKSIMGLLLLGAAAGTTIVLRATGEDGPAALHALVDLVEAKFGERE